MSEPFDFRSWAAQAANRAANERDDTEVVHLTSSAVYRQRLADLWLQHGMTVSNAKTHKQAS